MTRVASVFSVNVNEIGRLCIDVPVEDRTSDGSIGLESQSTYVFRQPGYSNAGLIQFQIVPSVGDTPVEFVETRGETGNDPVSYVPADSTVAIGTLVSYHGRLTNGVFEQVTQTQYKSYLDQDGECYVSLLMPTSLDANSVIRISAASFGVPPNIYKVSIIPQKVRVQTGDYVWIEAILEEKNNDSWIPVSSANDVSTIAERLICSVALKRDNSILLSDIY